MKPDRPTSEARTPPSPGGQIPPATLEGWYVLHQLFRIDWPGLDAAGEAGRAALASFDRLLAEPPEGEDGWSGAYEMVGGSIDLMLLHFRRDLEGLSEARRAVALSDLAPAMELDHEYLSVVELGLYALTAELASRVDPADTEAWEAALAAALEEQRDKGFVRRRLYPRQPDTMPYVCYYPMDKRRAPGQNWYALPLARRAELMAGHGTVGRRYAGRISQVISGSVGLDDWEWAVTLWSADPLDFKRIITDMRYDEASADFAEFGPFYVGKRLLPGELAGRLPSDRVSP